MSNQVPFEVEFTDSYGEQRRIHRDGRGRLTLKQEALTPALALNQVVTAMIGARIKEHRIKRGMTMRQLAEAVGMGTGNPKQRIYAIENATRGQGVRMGTVYALAAALRCEVRDLVPSVDDVMEAADVRKISITRLGHDA